MSQWKQNQWNKAHYQRYSVSIRKDIDYKLIDYIEKRKEAGENTSEIFIKAMEEYRKNH